MKRCRLLLAICLLPFLFSCENNGENKDLNDLTLLTSDSVSVTGLTGDSVKLVKTASTTIKVKDVEQSTRAVSALAHKLGGMLTLQNLEAVEQGSRELKLSSDSLLVITAVAPKAEITARIPARHLEDFLFGVADLGYFTGRTQLQVDDKSLVHLQNSLKQKAGTEALLASPSGRPSTAASTVQAIAVKDQSIEQNIANRAIDADVAYSTVSLSLFQNAIVKKEIVANPYLDHYELSFWKRPGNALEKGWLFFPDFLVAVAHLWLFIAMGILLLFVFRLWQQRKKIA